MLGLLAELSTGKYRLARRWLLIQTCLSSCQARLGISANNFLPALPNAENKTQYRRLRLYIYYLFILL